MRKDNQPYVVAETAYSFQGDQSYLEKQIACLKDTNIDCIKFHLIFNAQSYAVQAFTVLHDYFKEWILSPEVWQSLLQKCKDQGLDTLVLADDVETVEFCEQNPELVDGIEVHAACVNDLDIMSAALDFASQFDKTFFIGVSGFEFQELSAIMEYISKRNPSKVVLMYGFQNFPTKLEEINLSRMDIIRRSFGYEVGYADHTKYDDENKENIIYTAFSLGARIQEIHFVLKEGEERIDYITGLEAPRIEHIKSSLMRMSDSIGSVDFRLNEGEKKYLNFRKVPVYARDLPKGTKLEQDMICFKRVESPLKQHKFREVEEMWGRTLGQDVKQEAELKPEDFND